MKCIADNCERKAIYRTAQLCQKHYFRVRRTGMHADRVYIRKARLVTPNGYIRLYLPGHPLADQRGYVFEHRAVMWDSVGGACETCALCGKPETWQTCHVDHRDDDRVNNAPSNLRILCRGCNVMRGHTATSMGSMLLTVDGVTMTPTAWARQDGVCVSSATIRRRKNLGASDEDAVFGEKITHRNKDAKKRLTKYDEVRGIGCGQEKA